MKSFIYNLKSKVHAALSFFSEVKSKGFTLIELLIVIVLLAILSGVLLSVINPEKVRDDTREAVRISDLRKVSEAVETHAKLEGGYPESQADLISSDYISNWPEDVTYTHTDSSFTVSTPTSSSEYLVYSSYGDQIVSCPEGEITEDCEKLSGGVYVAPCVPPGQDCEDAAECCLEAPHCSGGVCRDCLAEGTNCRGSSECCSSAPYCIDVCRSCIPSGSSCSDASECCDSVPFCPSGACVACLSLGYSCSSDGACCGSTVCTSNVCSLPCVSAGGSCGQSSDCCSGAPYCVSNTCVSEYNVALGKPIIDSGGTLAWYYGATFVERITDGDRDIGPVTQTNSRYDPGRVVIDLQGEFAITKVAFKYSWDGRFCPVDFKISYSNMTSVQMDDATDWTEIYTADDQNHIWIERSFSNLNARYIKAEYPPFGCWGGWGHIYEVEVYGGSVPVSGPASAPVDDPLLGPGGFLPW